MVSTRSKTAQTHLEDFAARSGSKPQKGRKDPATKNAQTAPPKEITPSKKRKASTSVSDKSTSKRSRTVNSKRADSAQAEDTSTILINRAPVLQLWSACVAHRLYPSLPWTTCISVGSAISTICAMAKGRSIGKISERDESEEKNRRRKEAGKKQAGLEEIHVMHFKLKLKEGLAIVGSEQKGKPANEDALKKKFGESQYEKAKHCFEEALESWGEEDEEQLNREAFHFYEEFRPTVKSGQKGWGRKGELNLETVKRVVQKRGR